MVRSALPQNYVKSPGYLADDFEDVSGWIVTGGTGTFATDTEHVLTGAKSLKMAVTAGTVYAIKNVSLSVPWPASQPRTVVLPFYIETTDDIASIRISISSTGSASVARRDFSVFVAGWNYFYVAWPGIHPLFGLDAIACNLALPIKWIEIQIVAKSGHTLTVWFDKLWVGIETYPRCCIMFDDALDDVIDLAYPIMQPKGIPGTIYVIQDNVGDAGYCDLAELTTLKSGGWCIANHTKGHEDLTAISESEAQATIESCRDYLIANGFGNGAYHLAYPNGAYNATVRAATAAAGMKTGRLTSTSGIYMIKSYYYDYLALPSIRFLSNALTLSDALTDIDNAIKSGSSIFFYTHGVDGTSVSSENLQAIVDYLFQKRASIKTVGIDEWYNGLTNPRYRSVPIQRASDAARTRRT